MLLGILCCWLFVLPLFPQTCPTERRQQSTEKKQKQPLSELPTEVEGDYPIEGVHFRVDGPNKG